MLECLSVSLTNWTCIYTWLSQQKHDMFTHKLKFIVLCQLIATLNNTTLQDYCLHWLMSTNLLFQSAFVDHVNSWLMKWCQQQAPIWHRGLDMVPLSVHVCLGLVVEYWPLRVHVHVRATLNSTICVILLLCLSCCHHLPLLPSHAPTPTPLPPTPLYMLAQY